MHLALYWVSVSEVMCIIVKVVYSMPPVLVLSSLKLTAFKTIIFDGVDDL